MKKKILIIVLIIVFLILGFSAFMALKPKEIKLTKSLTEKISEKIDNKEDLLIYITDKHENCYLCTDCNYIIDFYKDAFDLEFLTFNKSKNSEKDYSELMKKLRYEDINIKSPAVVMVKDGEVKGTANEIVSETILKKFLIDFEFIDKNSELRDYQVDNEKFKELLKSNEKNVFIVYTFEGSHYDFRKRILKLSNKYNFNYGLIYSGMARYSEVVVTVREILGDKYKVPMVIITQNGSIIDYINSIKEQDLVEFLKKNEII